jgi:hypothetical protein
MTLGLAERQCRLGNVAVARCEQKLPERSIYRLFNGSDARSCRSMSMGAGGRRPGTSWPGAVISR